MTDEPGDAASDLALERAPARLPPWRDLPVYLRGRLEAGVLLPDFTIVPGSKFDPKAYADEKELRKMDIIIKAQLAEGRPMFYKSPGNSNERLWGPTTMPGQRGYPLHEKRTSSCVYLFWAGVHQYSVQTMHSEPSTSGHVEIAETARLKQQS